METPDLNEEMNDPFKEVIETLPKKENTKRNEEIPMEEHDYLDDYVPTTNQKSYRPSAPVMFGEDNKGDNIINWVLRVDWERIEHVLRGHKPKVDDEGNEYFERIDNHYLNDYGVNMVLHFLSGYLSKEIFLARYTSDQKSMIMKQFSRRFIHFFYDNIREFGMDTPEKKKIAPMFVQMVIDLVDASYSRAVEGRQVELILKQFTVYQNQPLSQPFNPLEDSSRKKGMMQRIFS